MPLIDEQLAALWDADGSPLRQPTLVSARPGTGKTTTVTEYCISLVETWRNHYAPWQGMAILSYTNVAKHELERKIRERGTANALLSAPHFVGTLDAFLNRNIFLPFGAEQMGYAGGRPKLVGELLPAQRDVDMAACAPFCKVGLKALPGDTLAKIQRDCKAFGSSKKVQNQSLSTLFAASDDQMFLTHPDFPDVHVTFSTVHSVKGETYDGVVFYMKARVGSTCGCATGGTNLMARVLQHDLVGCEEKRIAYVALSRAARTLTVLAPEESLSAWKTMIG